MRKIRIVAEGVLNEIFDTQEKSLEETTKDITKMMKSDKVVTILGLNSSIVIRPSTVSAVTIVDDGDTIFTTSSDSTEFEPKESKENTEQKSEEVDEITDM